MRKERRTYPRRPILNIIHISPHILLNELHLRSPSDHLKDTWREAACVSLSDNAIINVLEPRDDIPYVASEERVRGFCKPDETEMHGEDRGRNVVLEHDDVGVGEEMSCLNVGDVQRCDR